MGEPSPTAPALREELLRMVRDDWRVRSELAADGSLFEGYHPRMRAVHDANAARLASLLAAGGWPGETQVGRDGAEAAWIVVQHAIAQPALMRQGLGALREAAGRGEVPAWQPAMLEDRVRTLEGSPQRYGTQLDWDEAGLLSPLPIEDPAGVDRRRRAVGLRPLAEEVAARRRAAEEEGERAPAAPQARLRAMRAWLRDVGWRRDGDPAEYS